MNIWLFKEEPSHYGWEALVRDGRAAWTGVKNPLAQKHLRGVRRGDRILYYHTGGEKAVVGVARAATAPYPDPADPKRVAVDIVPVGPLARPVSLREIKADPRFAAFPLVRISRLSVMPVSAKEWKAIESMARERPSP